MKSPKDFFKPLAVGAPQPLHELPQRPSRMIHFFPPSNAKMVAKVPAIAPTVDILLGNLEDGVPADEKEAARAGLVEVGKSVDFGETQFWTRVNSLDSPWVLDDLWQLVHEIGHKLDVIMIPKVEGPEDIHYVDRMLAQLEAKVGLTKPLQVHAISRPLAVWPTLKQSVVPASYARSVTRPGRPGSQSADEDNGCGRRTSRVSGAR